MLKPDNHIGDKLIKDANDAVDRYMDKSMSFKGLDFAKIPFRNSQINSQKTLYEKNEAKNKKLSLPEKSYSTGNTWFDIGRSIALKRALKRKNK